VFDGQLLLALHANTALRCSNNLTPCIRYARFPYSHVLLSPLVLCWESFRTFHWVQCFSSRLPFSRLH